MEDDVINATLYPVGYTPSVEDGEVSDQQMMQVGDGDLIINEQMMPQSYVPSWDLVLTLVKCTNKELVERSVVSIDGTDLLVAAVDNSISGGSVHYNQEEKTITQHITNGEYDTIKVNELPTGLAVGKTIVIETNDDASDLCKDEAVFNIETNYFPPFYFQVYSSISGWTSVPSIDDPIMAYNFAYKCRYFSCDDSYYRVSKFLAGDDFLVDSCDPDNTGNPEELVFCEKAAEEYDEDWGWDYDYSDDTIERTTSADIGVTSTNTACYGPFIWSVEGVGFWFNAEYTITEIETAENYTTLYADETSCGPATITVSDDCQTVTGYVRGTEGLWVLKESNTNAACVLSGSPTSYDVGGAWFEKIVGYQKVYQAVNKLGSAEDTCENIGSDWLCAQCGGEVGCDYWACNACISYYAPWGDYLVPYTQQERCYYYESTGVSYYEWECA